MDADLISTVLANAPAFLVVVDAEARIKRADGLGLRALSSETDIVGKSALNVWRDIEMFPDLLRALSGSTFNSKLSLSGRRYFDAFYAPLRDLEQKVTGAVALGWDVTQRRTVEEELREKVALVEEQMGVIEELGAPVLVVKRGVLCLPILGSIDRDRSAVLTEALLSAIIRERARVAVIDITGIEVVDTGTADGLVRMFGAAGMLGAKMLVSGMRARVAQTLVELGVDLSRIRTTATLADALSLTQSSVR